MKKIKLGLIASITLIAVIMFSLQSCEDEEQIQNDTQEINLVSKILKKETAMDDILLPAGTKISPISESQMEIELPENFKFLLYNEKDGVSYSRFGSYSCTCSGSNSCKSFYNSSVGYGCLQNSCTGSCTGTPSGGDEKKIAYGIVNITSDQLLGEKFVNAGNLTHKGYEIFLENVAKDKILELTEFAYSNSEFKNSSELIEAKGEEFGTQIVLQYMGISFATIVPEFENDKQAIQWQQSKSVSCAGSNGCSCTKDKTCFLGQCVYTCEGCTTCTISADEK